MKWPQIISRFSFRKRSFGKFVCLIGFGLLLQHVSAQSISKDIRIEFVPLWGEQKLLLNCPLSFGDKDTLIVEKLRWYISGVKLKQGIRTVFEDSEKARLLDAGDSGTLTFKMKLGETEAWDALVFNAGIDSQTNCSGALTGDLDPVKGMYWTWQSGYINTKIEALSMGGKEWQLHLGGYREPFACIRNMVLETPVDTAVLTVGLNLKLLMEKARKEQINRTMQPGKNAFDLSNEWAKGFKLMRP